MKNIQRMWILQSKHYTGLIDAENQNNIFLCMNHRCLFSLTVGHLWTEPGEEESMFMEIENQTGKFRYGSWNSENQTRKFCPHSKHLF